MKLLIIDKFLFIKNRKIIRNKLYIKSRPAQLSSKQYNTNPCHTL